MLKISNLSFGYIKAPLIIKDFELSLKDGEKALILGGEGMGKTTLLKIISGLEKQYFGDVVVDGKQIKDAQKNKCISFLQSEPVLLNGSLMKNLEWLFKVEGIYLDNDEIYKIFNMFDFNYDLKTKVKKLPLVDKRIFAMIRSYIKNPKLILMDDQTLGLNELMIDKIKSAINVLCGDKSGVKTVVMVNNLDCKIDFDKYIYLSYSKNFCFNLINELYNNPVDLFITNYLNFDRKEMVLTNKNGEYFICDYSEVFDKKRKNYEITIENMCKINKNKHIFAENLELNEGGYIKISLLSKEKILKETLNHIDENLNKSIFVFDSLTGAKLT